MILQVSCQTIWRVVSEYVDGELDPEFRNLIANHVAACSNCTALVDGVYNVLALAADERLIPFPQGFGQRLLERIALLR